MSKQITNEEFIWRLSCAHNDIIAIDKYAGMHTKIRFQCKKEHIWLAEPDNVLRGSGCPYCNDKAVLIGYNDIWTTRPDIARLFVDPEDGYKYTKSAHNKVNFRCPKCGKILNKRINDVYNCGLSCSRCSDGVSYPNKFARALLDQLPVVNHIHEYHPDWLKPYFYDNYFEYNNKKYVLEMDGGLGHGKKRFGSKDKDTKGLEIDVYKDTLAIQQDIQVIRVDCDYKMQERFEYIKNNLLSSYLGVIFDLSSINWHLCDQISQESLVKKACDLYSSGIKNFNEIASILRVDKTTVHRYIKNGTRIGWCDYDPQRASAEAKAHNCNTIPINMVDDDVNIIYKFCNIQDCINQIKELYDINIYRESIINSCRTYKPYKGFNFRFAKETQQND